MPIRSKRLVSDSLRLSPPCLLGEVRWLHMIALAVGAALTAGSAAGEAIADPETPVAGAVAPTGATQAADQGFRPPASELAKSDWIKLDSGEWVRGKIEHMRDGDLSFDSDKLDDLVISWDDVAELHSPAVNRFVFEDQDDPQAQIIVEGPAMLVGDTVTVNVDGEPQSYPRRRILAILEGRRREINNWSFGAGLGMTARAGNTRSVDLGLNAYVKRESARSRWNTTYLGAIATVDGETNTDNHRVNSRFDWFLTRRLYLIPLLFDFYKDRFQDIKYRLTPAAGLGYEVFSLKSITWDVLAGAGYQYTRFTSDDREGTFVTVLGTGFEADITRYLEFDFLYYLNLGVPDLAKTTHHGESGFDFDIWGPLDFEVNFTFDRQEDPPAGVKKDDFRMIVGLGVDF
jgi:putative salt-induced outer membrane protein YdiY